MARTGVFLDWGLSDDYEVWTAKSVDGEIVIHREGVTGPRGGIEINETMTESEFLEKFGDFRPGEAYRAFQVDDNQ